MTRTTGNTPVYLNKIHNYGDSIKIILSPADGATDGIEMTVKGHLSVKPFQIDSRLTCLEIYQDKDHTAKELHMQTKSRTINVDALNEDVEAHASYLSGRTEKFRYANDRILTKPANSTPATANAKLQDYTEGLLAGIELAKEVLSQELHNVLEVSITDGPTSILEYKDGKLTLSVAAITV